MNKLFTPLLVLSFLFADQLSAQSNMAVIAISNPIPIERKGEVISVSWNDILSRYPKIDTANFKIVNPRTKKELPWQLEFKGGKNIQNLLIQIDIAAIGILKLEVQKGKPTRIVPKTYGRYVPERKDDFAWENDKIAFRMYGKALEESPSEMAYGMDVWVKRTDRLILNERYKRGNYHTDIGDGLDYYQVGSTLGAGDIAPFVNDSIYYPKNYRRWSVLDNGPLRTTFVLEYDEWDVKGTRIKATKKISLDAGSQLSRVEAQFSGIQNSSRPVVIGIAKRKEPGSLLLNEQDGLMAYWEPRHGEDGTIGVGSVILSPVSGIKVTEKQLLAMTNTGTEGLVVYYTGAAWDKANEITSSKAWFEYIQSFKARLLNPLKISIK